MSGHCLYCDSSIQGEISWQRLLFPSKDSFLCKICLEKLQVISGVTCEKCFRPLTQLSPEYISKNMCIDCIRWERDSNWKGVLDKNISLYVYNGFLKEVLARYKFRGDYELVKAFSPQIASALKVLEYDHLVPIPLSSERLKERGFNQSEALALTADFETSDLLIRIHSEKQSKKSRRERLRQKAIFELSTSSSIKGKTILLLDDIYTTGSTIHHAAKTLKDAGASSIQAFTLARG